MHVYVLQSDSVIYTIINVFCLFSVVLLRSVSGGLTIQLLKCDGKYNPTSCNGLQGHLVLEYLHYLIYKLHVYTPRLLLALDLY